MFGKAEICNFKNIIFNKDILGFEITMYDSNLSHLTKTVQDLYQILHNFFLLEPAFVHFQHFSKSTTLGKFKYNIEIVNGFVNIIKPDNVWTFELLIDLNFRIEGSFSILILHDFSFVDDFNSYLFFGFFINSFKNFGKCTTP
jgi:hypothetical protein